jgi:alkylated DNA repair dioxygenase AlkB
MAAGGAGHAEALRAASTPPRLLLLRDLCSLTSTSSSHVRHWDVSRAQRGLFDEALPAGFHYRRDFITADEEALLVEEISRVEFSNFEMRGVVARRRVAFFGRSYDEGSVSPPLPAFLLSFRASLALWAAVDADALAMAVINKYPPGAPIGWHRDAPQYGIVAGMSLLSPCSMKFRPYLRREARSSTSAAPRRATHEITLEPRSAYLMTRESRHAYEHHIPAVTTLRYSITFRTVRVP